MFFYIQRAFHNRVCRNNSQDEKLNAIRAHGAGEKRAAFA